MINRVLQVKIVKPKKKSATETVSETEIISEDLFSSRLYDVELVAQSVMFNIGIGVTAYVLLDTFRQSMIALASK